MRTTDVVELESTDSGLFDLPLPALVVVVEFHELSRVGHVHHEASVRPRTEYHRALLNTRHIHLELNTGKITAKI